MKWKFETTRFMYSPLLIIPVVCLLCYNFIKERERDDENISRPAERITGMWIEIFLPSSVGSKGPWRRNVEWDIFRRRLPRFSFFFFFFLRYLRVYNSINLGVHPLSFSFPPLSRTMISYNCIGIRSTQV